MLYVSAFFAPVRKSCQHPVRWKRRYEFLTCVLSSYFDLAHVIQPFSHVDPIYVCLSSLQHKQQEIERVEKWLKMVKNWDKYRNTEKVCTSIIKSSLPICPTQVFDVLFPLRLIIFVSPLLTTARSLMPLVRSRPLKPAHECHS